MKRIAATLLLTVFLVVFAVFATSRGRAQTNLLPPEPPLPPPVISPDTSTQRVIVRFRPFTPNFLKDRLHTSLKTQVIAPLLAKDTFVIRVPAGAEEMIAKAYQQNLLVELAEVDAVALAFEVPNDPQLPNQWGQAKINTPGAWDTTHAEGRKIAILDTGVAQSHPDVSSKVDRWVNFSSSSTAYDRDGHGTHVAGIAAAVTNNGTGVAGTAYNTRLYSVKVLNDTGAGYYSWVINGIYWAADNGADVINMSLGGTSGSSALEQAVNYAWNKGVVLVAAAGNTGNTRRHYPAYYEKNIAVAATDQADRKASFSTYGSWVDVAAPGTAILSSVPDDDYESWNGTSMSTPHVSGVVSLIKSAFPSFTNQQVRQRLEETADAVSGTGTYWVKGRINAAAALNFGSPSPTPPPTPTTTPTPTPTLEPTPTPTPSPTPNPTPTPTSTPSSKPWWCKYIPDHYTCQ